MIAHRTTIFIFVAQTSLPTEESSSLENNVWFGSTWVQAHANMIKHLLEKRDSSSFSSLLSASSRASHTSTSLSLSAI